MGFAFFFSCPIFLIHEIKFISFHFICHIHKFSIFDSRSPIHSPPTLTITKWKWSKIQCGEFAIYHYDYKWKWAALPLHTRTQHMTKEKYQQQTICIVFLKKCSFLFLKQTSNLSKMIYSNCIRCHNTYDHVIYSMWHSIAVESKETFYHRFSLFAILFVLTNFYYFSSRFAHPLLWFR